LKKKPHAKALKNGWEVFSLLPNADDIVPSRKPDAGSVGWKSVGLEAQPTGPERLRI